MPTLIEARLSDAGSQSFERRRPGSVDTFLRARIAQKRRRRERRRFLVVASSVVVAVIAAAWIDDATSGSAPPPSSTPLATDTSPSASPDGEDPALSGNAASRFEGGAPNEASSTSVDRPEIAPPASVSDTGATTAPRATAAPIDDPVRIEIPAIGVDADLVGVGLNADRSMEVPDFGLAGWYTEGPAPGAPGPAVIAAHVDSYQGPDVFFRLRELEPGDEIHVHGADGRTLTWKMYASQLADKDELPINRIWSTTDQPALRLITCGGTFDRSARSYTSNVIVYATLVEA